MALNWINPANKLAATAPAPDPGRGSRPGDVALDDGDDAPAAGGGRWRPLAPEKKTALDRVTDGTVTLADRAAAAAAGVGIPDADATRSRSGLKAIPIEAAQLATGGKVAAAVLGGLGVLGCGVAAARGGAWWLSLLLLPAAGATWWFTRAPEVAA